MYVERESFEARLREVSANARRPEEGVFGPRSETWTVARETIVFLGAGRAALLQLAHPYVAHAIAEHSRTRADPLGRFNRTFLHVYAMLFGPLEGALASAERVRRVHEHIEGTIDPAARPYPRGHVYRANEAEALLWVFATLVETAVLAYEMGFGTLPLSRKDRIYEELKAFARLFGVPESLFPRDWSAFVAYCARTFEALAVTTPAREMGGFLLSAPRAALAPVMAFYRTFTVGFLPPVVREGYGFAYGPREARTFERGRRLVRRLWPLLPERARFMPDYVEARRRLAGETAPRDDVGRAVEQALLSALRPLAAAASRE